jgi:hypothetical protein
MDNLVPNDYSFDELDEDQINYLVVQLATTNDPFKAQGVFTQFFKRGVTAQAVLKVQKEHKADIEKAKEEIYNDLYNIPISHAYVRLALANSRIEHLLKNPNDRQVLREMVEGVIDGVRIEREQPVKYEEINEKEVREWAKFAQNEQLMNEKLKLEMIIKRIEDETISKTGFRPVKVNTRVDFGEVE